MRVYVTCTRQGDPRNAVEDIRTIADDNNALQTLVEDYASHGRYSRIAVYGLTDDDYCDDYDVIGTARLVGKRYDSETMTEYYDYVGNLAITDFAAI